MARTRKLFSALTRRGPHKVLRGDLAFAGLPGVVYTPESGMNLPGIAFGHEWLARVEHYQRTLEHLASWGIVAAAPNTELGFAPSASRLAFDLGTALDIIAGVRLGSGKISVHPQKLGLVGHGFGGSAAILATAERQGTSRPAAKTVVAVSPTVTRPSPVEQAARLSIPGLLLGVPDDPQSLRSNVVELARVWDGAVRRTVKGGTAGGLIEGRRLAKAVGLPGAHRSTQKAVRALMTGFLLNQLAGDKTYREFTDPDVELPKTEPLDLDGEPITVEDKVVALLKS